MKFLSPILAALAIGLLTSAAFAYTPATVLLEGVATTGVGSPLPVNIDPSKVTVRADGAIGLGYTYQAGGRATGDIPGTFTYEEHGYLFFRNPADPRTYVGGRYDGGTVAVTSGSTTTVVNDTNPAAYQAVTKTATLPLLDSLLGSYGPWVVPQLGLSVVGNTVTYGAFTFTTSYGTSWGVSTPDSRHFFLRTQLPVGENDNRQGQDNQGAGFQSMSRFAQNN